MQYLVTMEFIDPGPLLSPEQLAPVAQNQTIPTLEFCAKLAIEGKIRGGGVAAGARNFIFIADVSDNDELDKLIQKIPAWLVTRTTVTPLQDFGKRLEQNRDYVKQMTPLGG